MSDPCVNEIVNLATRTFEVSWWQQFLALIPVLLIERWLGRTGKVKAASILDLIKNSLGVMWRWAKSPFTKGKENVGR